MTNLNNDHQNNLVSFLRHNKPIPPNPHPNLEQQLFDSLEPRKNSQKSYFKTSWIIPNATNPIGEQVPKWIQTLRAYTRMSVPVKLITTGFLFTFVSFGLRTPQIALEPKDLENFLVRNWQNTLDNNNYTATEETEAYWLLPVISEPQPTLSISAQ